MESSKYDDLVRYLREEAYPTGANKNAKYVLRRLAKKFIYDEDCKRLFFTDDAGQGGSTFKKRKVNTNEILLANTSVQLLLV